DHDPDWYRVPSGAYHSSVPLSLAAAPFIRNQTRACESADVNEATDFGTGHPLPTTEFVIALFTSVTFGALPTVTVTATVCDPALDWIVTEPFCVPAAARAVVIRDTEIVEGVDDPFALTLSQLAVDVAVKARGAADEVTLIVCAGGAAPPSTNEKL